MTHALFAGTNSGAIRRMSDWTTYEDAMARWTTEDDARFAGERPGVKWYSVRSTTDEGDWVSYATPEEHAETLARLEREERLRAETDEKPKTPRA
jgi:hypothetical protein